MKIKIMTKEAIAYVKENLNSLLPFYQTDERPEKWLKDKLGKPAFIEVDSLEFEDFELHEDADNPSSTDITNIKLFYRKLMSINDSFATDERLWAGLSHTIFYDYLKRRWNKIDCVSILNHYFLKSDTPRFYMVNTLARLWWLGRKTYRENDDNQFEILDYISHDINGYSFTLFGSNWSNSDITVDMFFHALKKFEKSENVKVGRDLFNDALKFTNGLCGIYIVDACDSNFIENKIYEFVCKRYAELIKFNEMNRINNVKSTGILKLDNLIKAINLIGGHGNTYKIIEAYGKVVEKDISSRIKDYIKYSLERNCPNSRKYDGKPIFYKIIVNESILWKVANEYLTKSNISSRNALIKQQRDSLDSDERVVFQLICAMKTEKFEIKDLMFFKQQLSQIHKGVDFEKFIPKQLNRILEKGLIELIDKDVYKKTYKDIKE